MLPRIEFKRHLDQLFENSAFLVIGALGALLSANFSSHFYHGLVTEELHFLVNEVLMALFFMAAGKEIREAMLPGGALAKMRVAALPLLATMGGMIVPATLFFTGASLFAPELKNGWAVPMATDIAFSYLLARVLFGDRHPVIPFLLLIAIADDAGGLITLAVFYPVEPLQPLMLGLIALAIGVALFMYKTLKVQNFWWYLVIPGSISWIGFYMSGLHPALALVPIVWCMPHELSDMGLFGEENEEVVTIDGQEGELHRTDALNQFAYWWKRPIDLILGLFGFVNAGVAFTALGTGTGLVLVGLMLGKPLGITLFTLLGIRLGLQLPEGLNFRHIIVIGCVAGIGFTVSLFVTTVAFPVGPIQDEVKMGALLSVLSALTAFGAARLLRGSETK